MWHQLSGPEWTVNRLKSLEQYAKDRFEGKNPTIPLGWAVSSSRRFSKRFADDLLHEIFSSNKFDIDLALNFTRLSSSISLFKRTKNGAQMLPPSKTQLNKMLNAIEGVVAKPANMHLRELSPVLCSDAGRYKFNRNAKVLPMLYYPMSDTTAPFMTYTFSGKSEMKVVERNLDLRCWDISPLYSYSPLMNFFVKNQRYISTCILGDGDTMLPLPSPASIHFNDVLAGTITPIQELGCKLRAAANPMIVLQAINEPLKVILQEISKTIPQICTFDQDRGRKTLKEWITSGVKVWSLDASSFTDRFPLDFQLEVLKRYCDAGIVSKPMVEVFQITSGMKYWFKPINRAIEYKYGQPQGLGPSFPLATVAHYELLKALCKIGNIDVTKFMVLGDDVIIADEMLANFYSKWMKDCNVDINMTKSIISDKLGEFAGVQVTPEKIISRQKLGPLKSNDSFIAMYDSHYANHRPAKYLNFMFEEHSSLVKKLSLPEDLGGRRNSMLGYHSQHTLPLNQFSISKTRLLKDLKEIIPYSPEDVISFLNTKEEIKTGIFNSLCLWADDVGLCKDLEYTLSEHMNIFKLTTTSALQQAQIREFKDKVQQLIQEIKLTRSTKELEAVIKNNNDVLSFYGYIKDNLPQELWDGDFNTVLAKQIHENKNYFLEDPIVLKRKDKKAVDHSWFKHLG